MSDPPKKNEEKKGDSYLAHILHFLYIQSQSALSLTPHFRKAVPMVAEIRFVQCRMCGAEYFNFISEKVTQS